MPRVAFVAFDACDHVVASEAMAAGRMPNLERLSSRASRHSLQPPAGLYVGSIWPSIATGHGPGAHGIYSWRQFVSGSYATKRMRPAEIGVEPIWVHLSQQGATVAVVDAPLSAPHEQVNGLQIVDWGSHDRWMAPVSVGGDELLRHHSAHPIGVRCDHSARQLDPHSLLDTIIEGVRAKGQLTLDVATNCDWDLLFAVFAESHCVGHHFWKHHDRAHVDHDPGAAAAFGTDPVHQVYEALDVELGRLLATFDDNTVVVMVLSHGFVPHYGGEHILNDALAAIEHSIVPRSRWREVSGAAGRIQHWLTKKAKQAAGGGDPSLASLDGSRAFFQIPNNERFGGVRLNLEGREPSGFIDPTSPTGAGLIDRLEDELRALRCPDTGRKLVVDVLRVDDHHPGPLRSSLPDLLVDWDWSTPIHAAVSDTIGRVDGSYTGVRSGDHRGAGQVFITGDQRTAEVGAISCEDLAPTLAAMLGHPMAGTSGQALVAPV